MASIGRGITSFSEAESENPGMRVNCATSHQVSSRTSVLVRAYNMNCVLSSSGAKAM